MPRDHGHTLRPQLDGRRKISSSKVFAGENVGITEVSEHPWLVTFVSCDSSFFDLETVRVESAHDPFAAKCYPSLRYRVLPM